MSSKRHAARVVRLILVGLLIAGPRTGSGFDGGGRTFELQRDLRTVRPRVDRQPRASAYDLRNLARRLHEERIDAPRDPRLFELESEARRLRWQADRNARLPASADRPRASALATGAPMAKSRHLGGAHTSVGAAPTAPDFGRRVVALQRQIGQIEERLERADAAAAARLLEAAEADLAVLRGASSDAVANDPNLIALAARLAALKERVE